MKMKNKKILSMLLSVVMVFTLFSGVVLAEGIQYESTEEVDFDISVPFGTEEADAIEELAGTVDVTGAGGEEGEATITWSITDYNANQAGDYNAVGVLELPDGWSGSPRDVEAVVAVEEEPVSPFGYSIAASGIRNYDENVKVDEVSEFELRFRVTDGNRFEGDENGHIMFYVILSGDASYIDEDAGDIVAILHLEDRNDVNKYNNDYHGEGFNVNDAKANEYFVVVENNRGDVELEIVTTVPDEVDVGFYKDQGERRRIDSATINVGSKEDIAYIELEVDKVNSGVDDGWIKAGKDIELKATAYDDRRVVSSGYRGTGWEVEGENVVFEIREKSSSKDWDKGWKKIDTVKTNRDGEAKVRFDIEKEGKYELRAVAGTWRRANDYHDNSVDSDKINQKHLFYDVITVSVFPGDADSIKAEKASGFHNIEDDTFRVYFEIADEYGNTDYGSLISATRGLSAGYDWDDIFGFRVVDPKGNIYGAGDIGDEIVGRQNNYRDFWCDDEEMFYVEVDYSKIEDELGSDAEGKYEVRGNIAGTTQRAYTTIMAAEFGELVEIRLELNPEVALRSESEFENAAEVTLVDDKGMEKDYKYGGEIRFSSSRNSVATVNRDEGHINPRSQGETIITAVHDDGFRDSATFYVGRELDHIEAVIDVIDGEKNAFVTLIMRDRDGYRTIDEGREDEEYDVFTQEEDKIDILNKKDFKDGKASFEVKVRDFGTYRIEVVTEEGNAVEFEVVFQEEVKSTTKTMVITIGSKTYTIDGEEFEFSDVEPFIRNDRTYLPIRAIMEAFEAQVKYDGADRSITITTGEGEDEHVVIFKLDETTYTVNGEEKEMDVTPYLDEEAERTYLPVRYFSQDVFGAEVTWDPVEEQVTIVY
ncbi:copper amine oxidase N-terminal domain-containing protein [Natranaerofaba carboxydovora]|uniref:copper amine oxidase N-terminal domain-containing protein n=1 Tax=Natranaerofaba carboxydovora TaxID=2742683 RepID=UPI001F13D134|nr:copper amine oxidase N-terminal domain-containing protein [Natranaerofaba carboxydovora]UMZ74699.1 hypothetical protein ACONDI_02299 [Natranaerofaba carboxydovora]